MFGLWAVVEGGALCGGLPCSTWTSEAGPVYSARRSRRRRLAGFVGRTTFRGCCPRRLPCSPVAGQSVPPSFCFMRNSQKKLCRPMSATAGVNLTLASRTRTGARSGRRQTGVRFCSVSTRRARCVGPERWLPRPWRWSVCVLRKCRSAGALCLLLLGPRRSQSSSSGW